MTRKKPFVLGLTGSIGMGKSTTAGFFRKAGIPVWDADAAVHRLYAKDGAAVAGIAEICPEAVIDNSVHRDRLRLWIAKDPGAIAKLNTVVHPLVAKDRADFIAQAADQAQPLVVVDVPLLYETRAEGRVDAVLVVSAPPDIQKARVLDRDGMTEDHFNTILSKQMPDAEKRKRADFVIETLSLDAVEQKVKNLLLDLQKRMDADA